MSTTIVDIAVDFMDMTNDRQLWTRFTDARPGFEPVAGRYAIVGDQDSDPAVAKILSADADHGIALLVLDGPVEDHHHLLSPA